MSAEHMIGVYVVVEETMDALGRKSYSPAGLSDITPYATNEDRNDAPPSN